MQLQLDSSVQCNVVQRSPTLTHNSLQIGHFYCHANVRAPINRIGKLGDDGGAD